MTTNKDKSNSPTFTILHQRISDIDRSYYINQTYNEIELLTEIIEDIVSHMEKLPYSNSELKERYNTLKNVRQTLGRLT